MELFHRFVQDVQPGELPSRFNNPFYYSPHRLCVIAAGAVRDILSCNPDTAAEAAEGKMFGVLVVKDKDGELGFLAAFSGLLCGTNMLDGFVPPVYDLQSPTGYFKQEEAEISRLNRMIDETASSNEFLSVKENVSALQTAMEHDVASMREAMRAGKERREALRVAGGLSAVDEASLVRESQFAKAELKRLTASWKERVAECTARLASLNEKVSAMKEERKRRSAALQEWLFGQFKVLNAYGQEKSLLDIFREHSSSLPPAGSGECAAPKLLQYAYRHGYKPLAVAEFWVGSSPAGEVRRDGCFYGACKSKCEPILSYMLQGLDVEENALEKGGDIDAVEVVYEDEHLVVVNKPADVLSVPGVVGGMSVQQWLRENHVHGNELFVVHRLDMATSGLLVAAKSMDVYKSMQGMFASRKVEKVYLALLDGVPVMAEGVVDVPLAPDYDNRPRQKMDAVNGKSAVTRYKVLDVMKMDGAVCALVKFEPVTGRTHQLRVHAACKEGLDTPIVGDALYGKQGKRLMLHASSLVFNHPVSGELLHLEAKVDFVSLFVDRSAE